jgi:hypothetical protein
MNRKTAKFHHLRKAVGRQDTACTNRELMRGINDRGPGKLCLFQMLNVWLVSIEAGTCDTSSTEGGVNLADIL